MENRYIKFDKSLIIEVDGVRHRLVEGNVDCNHCSLYDKHGSRNGCGIVRSACIALGGGINYHFVKEK